MGALDNNPQVLRQYTDEDEQELELNSMLDLMIGDVIEEIKKSNNFKYVGGILFDFVHEYFDVIMESMDEHHVAKNLIKLYDEIEEGKEEYLQKLRTIDSTYNYSKYQIDFPLDVGKALTIQMNQEVEGIELESDSEGENEDKDNKDKKENKKKEE